MPQAVDEQPASNGASKTSNQLLVSIQTLEAIREFSKDVVPLQGDGSNLHSWTCEIEEVLDDLIQSPKYFQSGKPSNLNPEHDKIARKLIYWTIPRELRCCLRDSKSAHDSYESLKVQFHKNVRTLHMATFVELLNVRAEINEPSCVTLLYNYMYSKYQELINSGFRVEEDTIFGVMFQMAIGRSTSIKLYNEISEFLDSRMLTNHSGVSSLEVSSVARSRLEILKQSESYEEESLPATPQAIYSTKNPNNSSEEQQQQQPNSNVNGSEPYPVEQHANRPDEPPSSSKSRDKRPAVTPSPSESRIESSRNSTKNAKGDEPAPVSTPQPKPFAVAQPQPQPGQTLSSTQKQSSTDPKTQATPSSSSATLTVSQPSLTASQLSSKPPLTDQSKSPSKPSTNQTSNNDNDKKGSKSNSVIGVTSIFPATTTSSSTASHSDSRPSVFFPASFSSGTRPNSSTGSPSTTHSNNNNNNNNKNKPPNSSGGWNEKPPSNTPSNFKF